MKTVVLKSGLTLELDEKALDNMELVDTLTEVNGTAPLAVSKMISLVLGKDNKKLLYDSVRTEDGRVPVESVSNALKEIFEFLGEKGKNS